MIIDWTLGIQYIASGFVCHWYGYPFPGETVAEPMILALASHITDTLPVKSYIVDSWAVDSHIVRPDK